MRAAAAVGWDSRSQEENQSGDSGDRQTFEGGAIYSYAVEGPEMLNTTDLRRSGLHDAATWGFPAGQLYGSGQG